MLDCVLRLLGIVERNERDHRPLRHWDRSRVSLAAPGCNVASGLERRGRMHFAHRRIVQFLRGVGNDRKIEIRKRWIRQGARVRMSEPGNREGDLAPGVKAKQDIDVCIDEAGYDARRKALSRSHREQVRKNRAVVPSEMAICPRMVLPRIAPIRPCTNDDDRSLRDRTALRRSHQLRICDSLRREVAAVRTLRLQSDIPLRAEQEPPQRF